jgi:hypothetical protein
MSFEGTYVDGKVEFSEPPALENGSVVEVSVKPADDQAKPTLLGLLKLVGTIKDMPEGFSEVHDHYIHGTPRRTSIVVHVSIP